MMLGSSEGSSPERRRGSIFLGPGWLKDSRPRLLLETGLVSTRSIGQEMSFPSVNSDHEKLLSSTRVVRDEAVLPTAYIYESGLHVSKREHKIQRDRGV
jgi:hypothetical protein